MGRAFIGNFKGPKGEKGDPGPQGPMGPQGPVGLLNAEGEIEFEDYTSGEVTPPTPEEALADMVSKKTLKVILSGIKGFCMSVLEAGLGADKLISDKFSESKSYAIGDYVIYENLIYKFTAAKGAGAWDPNRVILVKVAEEIDEINGNITTLNQKIQSFELTKSEIVASALGKALGLAASNTWAQIIAKLKDVVNRGTLDWSSSNTTYTLQPGYYPGGTLDSRPSYTAGYNAGVAAGKATAASIQVRDNKNVAYISSGTQSISFTIPANTVAYCMVFCDYRTGYTALSETLSSGTVKNYDMQNLQVNVTGGHTYINRIYTISTGASSATFTLTATGAITGMLLY